MTQQIPAGSQWQQTAQEPQQFGGGQQRAQTQQQGTRLPQEYRTVLDSVARSMAVCAWCADQCIQLSDSNMVECIRACEEVVEIGETLLALAPRSSRFTPDVARAFEQAAQACAQECGRHQHAHCQECASVLSEATQSVRQLATTGGQQLSGTAGQQGNRGQVGQQMPADPTQGSPGTF
jgi:hypothetical protein